MKYVIGILSNDIEKEDYTDFSARIFDDSERSITEELLSVAKDLAMKTGDDEVFYDETERDLRCRDDGSILSYIEWDCGDISLIAKPLDAMAIEGTDDEDPSGGLWIISFHEIGERADSLTVWKAYGDVEEIEDAIEKIKEQLEHLYLFSEDEGLYINQIEEDKIVKVDDICADISFVAVRL